MALTLEDVLALGGGRRKQRPKRVERPASTRRALTAFDDFSVYRPTWNLKRTVRFLSVRKWRDADKREGIDAVKRAKREHDAGFAEAVAREVADALRLTIGASGFSIGAPPQGASCAWGEWHLASEVAALLGAEFGTEYRRLFAPRPRSGGSHPATWDTRGAAVLEYEPRGGLLVLVDDIATSGTTIEECCRTLRGYVPTLAVAWLYEGVKATEGTENGTGDAGSSGLAEHVLGSPAGV